MVIWLQASAIPKIDIFKISLFSHQNNYFAILLILNTQPWLKLLKNYELLCFKNLPQSWTKLVETKVENAVNSRNDSIFQIQNSPPFSQDQCWIWTSFVVKSLKLCQQHWFLGRGTFSLKKRFSVLSQQVCPRLSIIDIFWKNHPKLLNGIKMHVGVLYALNSVSSKL